MAGGERLSWRKQLFLTERKQSQSRLHEQQSSHQERKCTSWKPAALMSYKKPWCMSKRHQEHPLSLPTLVPKGQRGLILTKSCNNLLSPALSACKTASGRESCLGWKKCVVDARLSDVLKEAETYNFRWSEKLWSLVSPIAHLPAPLRGCPMLSAFSQVVLVCCSWFCYVPLLTLPTKITPTHRYFFLHVERDWYKQSLLQILAVG